MIFKTVAFAFVSTLAISITSASAGGFLADVFIKPFNPEAARLADEAHRQFKQANPSYGKWEEQLTNDVRRELSLQEHCEPLYNKWGEEVGCY